MYTKVEKYLPTADEIFFNELHFEPSFERPRESSRVFCVENLNFTMFLLQLSTKSALNLAHKKIWPLNLTIYETQLQYLYV